MAAMNLTQLRGSLALWRRRHRYRQRQLDLAHLHNDSAGIAKWHGLLGDAGKMVRRREEQIARAKPERKQQWMPGVRHRDRPSAGKFVGGFTPRGVLHTTEGNDFHVMEEVLVGKRAEPHFLIGRAGEIVQFIPLGEAAKALVHPAAVETNRAHAIQIERVGFAGEGDEYPAAQKAAMRKVMRFVERNAGVERASHVTFRTRPNHLSVAAWRTIRGWVGHQHVPGNSHWDPGVEDMKELLG